MCKKTILALCLAAALLAGAGCSSKSSDSSASSGAAQTASSEKPASSETAVSDASGTDAGSVPEASSSETASPDSSGLSEVFDVIDSTVQPGTAGNSLKATAAAVSLLDFAGSTSLDAAALQSAAADYVASLPEEDLPDFMEKVTAVAEINATLQAGDGEALLEDAGIEDSGYPWDDSVYEKAAAVFIGLGM